MDLCRLKMSSNVLLCYMKEQGYSRMMLDEVSKVISFLLNRENNTWDSYEDALDEYLAPYKSSSESTQFNKISRFKAVVAFDLYGKLPNGYPDSRLIKKGTYYKLNSSYRFYIDSFKSALNGKTLSESTIKCYIGNAASILLKLQERGCTSLNDVRERDLVAVFYNGGSLTSSDYRAIFLRFLKDTDLEPDLAHRLRLWTPKYKKQKKNKQYLTTGEAEIIRDTLRTGEGLSYRDRAIGTILYYTALRSIDIAKLKMSDIDWENDLIRIVQEKNDVPWIAPLSTPVGNAIYDYIEKERPPVNDPHLFISLHRPFKEVTRKTISGIVLNRIFDAACLRMRETDRRGSHLFRHHLTNVMLEHGIKGTIISDALGHQGTASIEPYLNTDFKNLKACALSIDMYPLQLKGTRYGL